MYFDQIHMHHNSMPEHLHWMNFPVQSLLVGSKNQEGSHWVQVGTLDAVISYFDSFGRPPPHEILKILADNGEIVLYSDLPIQSPLSQACGYHILAVSLLQAQGYTLLEILTDCYHAQEETYLRNDAYAAVLISSLTTLPERSLINLKEFTAK